MKKILLLAAGCLSLGAALAQHNTLSAAEKKAGWKLLFDGKTTAGWHAYNKAGIGESWKAVDGALVLDTARKGGGDIVTNEEFDNYDLKLEWRISPGGNSGIMFYVHEDPRYPNTFNTGPEMQVLDNDVNEDGRIPKHRAGDLYDLIKCSQENVLPVGSWNQVEISCKNGKVDLYLNGTHVVSTVFWDDNWWKLVRGSKFRDMPGFSKFKTGRIALQDHGFAVAFRDIKIRKL
jgi:hypothetical protein